ncbi:MBOAT family O-acyltransferase [Yersinia pekkanenii]|uniref:Probable alginate O-acetylase n=1 Tax=Yersinia pekkanenii TaxID=1288385 RepID=A0A0T9PMU4_9GAMM|nr:MBOAT family O-acyltransferase [Yersinia pekkanenii]CNH73411.1 D-alanyl-lipoteichoic acid biosynthesis protein DltB [Yersinia pekkanenii]CRY68044.1 D-alanyl-lipoteichoic acid biosynthesis protein DltB [Yersinia pekkanenii]
MAILFSIEFFLVFLIFFILYWLMSPWAKIQNIMLLLAGYYFVFLTSSLSLFVLLSWSLCVYLLVAMSTHERFKNKITLTLGVMVFAYFMVFKYYLPVSEWVQASLGAHRINLSLPMLNILLPLGLSFYLFNSVSLVLSVARGEISRPGLLSLLLYINFIPTLIAGPVNRAAALMPQIEAGSRTILDFKRAFYLIALALVKLFLLSSWLNETFVAPVFSLPDGQSGWDSIIAVYGWAWNIYFNFSGYTDLVTGIALLLGFRIAKNFAHPYLADTLKNFWRDWHISLSTFIRDYIYFPLGGSRKGYCRTQVNVMIAMVLSGIWHGAGLNFLLWGAIHGAGLVIYNLWHDRVSGPRKRHMPAILARLLTFHFVCFAWIFFRANNFDDAMIIISNISQFELASLTDQQRWTIGGFILVLIAYPELVNLRNRVAAALLGIKWYGLPLVIVPVLVLAFFFAPSGVPGFIYANF